MNKRMPQLFVVLTLFALLLSALPIKPVAAGTPTEDQFCENAEITSADHYWLINPHTRLSQTFKPSKNRLTSFMLALAGGADVNAAVTAKVYLMGGGLVTSKTETTQAAAVSWVEFDFPDVAVDTTKTYVIEITTPSNTAHWVVSPIECYANGDAYVTGMAQDHQDFGFVTYGYTFVPTTVAPVVVVSKPTSLSGAYYEAAGATRLSWHASSSTIDGYKIFRSKSQSSGFTKIAQVGSSTLEYMDPINTVPVKYYYYVKAYKGNVDSASSGTISVNATVTPTATATVEPTLIATVVPSVIATPVVSPTVSVFQLMLTSYFPQTITAFALLLLGVIALVVLLAKPKSVQPVTTTATETPVASVEPVVETSTTEKTEEIVEDKSPVTTKKAK